MLKCLLRPPQSRWALMDVSRSNSMFSASFSPGNRIRDSSSVKILYLNASHGPSSLVGVGAKLLIDSLKLPKKVEEIQLWNDNLVQYRLEHAVSKLNILRGEGTQEDENRFASVLAAAQTLNEVDIVVVSTPMWNYSIPYVLKQYLDTVIQPGINFNDGSSPALAAKLAGRTVVVVSSAGAEYPEGGAVKDFLNPYLQQVFSLMGFTRFYPIFIQGTGYKPKSECLEWTEKEARKVAGDLNKLLAEQRHSEQTRNSEQTRHSE